MLRLFKKVIRDSLPRRYQVPLKFWYSKLMGDIEDEMALLPILLKPLDRVIDIGANRGVYAYPLAKLGVKVELFEPNPACVQVLAPWAACKSNINLHPVALSDHEGSTELLIPVDAAGVEHDASASIKRHVDGQFRQQVVPLATLDSFQFNQVELIKIDVEGHEFSVIQGAQRTIFSATPVLLIEIEKRHAGQSFLEIFSWLRDKEYKSFFLDAGILRPIDEFDIDRDQPIENLGAPGKRYINNFLFLHESRIVKGDYSQLFWSCGRQ